MVHAIGNDHDTSPENGRCFTPQRATAMLPLVRKIAEEMISLSRSIDAQREQLRGVEGLPERSEQVEYQEELDDIRRSLEDDEERLQKCVTELLALGVEPHVPIDGSIDFPAFLDRRSVRLCWHPDDPQVEYWHEIDERAEDRKKIDSAAWGVKSLN